MKTKLPPCFDCGKRLQGNHHQKLFNKIDGHQRTFHKQCATQLLKDSPELWEKEMSYETWLKYIEENVVINHGDPVVFYSNEELFKNIKDLKLTI